MRVESLHWRKQAGWEGKHALKDAGLVLYFAGRHSLPADACYQELKKFYPNAHIMGCSTGGEIFGSLVEDDTVAVLATRFDRTALQTTCVTIESGEESFAKGRELGKALYQPDLKNVFLLSDGTHVNGSALIQGLYDVLPLSVVITGGLAGDGADFKCTTVGLDAPAAPKQIAAVGFYGDAIRVSYGSVGGWRAFGAPKLITRSRGNVLYELDGKPALQLYKVYLGEAANELPKNALLYPLNIRPDERSEHDIVRTIVDVNEAEQSLIFAGDVPENYYVRLMRGENEMLVHGASEAAHLAMPQLPSNQALAILVSCIGRKLFLGREVATETQAVADVFQNQIPTIGFYSYGEICHQQFSNKCSLHNQTMTVTVLSES